MTDQYAKAAAFVELHQNPGAFVLPNPWDCGSARILEGLGFPALATTSAGLAQTLGKLDGAVSLEETLAHCRALAAATTVPLAVDFENGYADSAEGVHDAVRQLIATGIVGVSIEDYDGSAIYERGLAVERIEAAVEAVRAAGFPVVLTARAENLLHGVDDLDDTIARLQAFEAAGADVLYAPGLRTLDQVRTVCGAVGRPVNVLAVMVEGATVEALAAAGAKRLSVGSALAIASLAPLVRASEELLGAGTFDWLAELSTGAPARRFLMSA